MFVLMFECLFGSLNVCLNAVCHTFPPSNIFQPTLLTLLNLNHLLTIHLPTLPYYLQFTTLLHSFPTTPYLTFTLDQYSVTLSPLQISSNPPYLPYLTLPFLDYSYPAQPTLLTLPYPTLPRLFLPCLPPNLT